MKSDLASVTAGRQYTCSYCSQEDQIKFLIYQIRYPEKFVILEIQIRNGRFKFHEDHIKFHEKQIKFHEGQIKIHSTKTSWKSIEYLNNFHYSLPVNRSLITRYYSIT